MSKRARKKHIQLSIEDAMPKGHGGKRAGAGKPKGRNVSHVQREEFPPRIPQHVTLRVVSGLPSLRQEALVGLIRGQIALAQREEFRIVQFVVEANHLHLICEADGRDALGRGAQQLESRLARRINRALGREGELFDDRYFSRSLWTPREVRNALCYVLNNERHHADERSVVIDARWFDPFSSAVWFDGWAEPLPTHERWMRTLMKLPPPVLAPRTWLLAVGWRRHGLLRVDEVPGRRWRQGRR
jgi:putative transposase